MGTTRSALGAGFICAMALVGGCAGPRWPETETIAGYAAGLEGAIGIHAEALPVDMSEALPDRLLLTDAVRLALTSDARVQAALWRVKQAFAEAQQARLLPNPIVEVAFRFPEGGGSPTIEAGLTAELLSLLRKPGEIDAADHRLRAASAEAMTVVLDALAAVERQYAELVSLEALGPVFAEQLAGVDATVKLAEERWEIGEGTRTDTTLLRAQRLELVVEVEQHALQRRTAALALARLMGRPSAEPTWMTELSEVGSAKPQAAGEEAAWVAMALERRPEIAAQVWELAALGVDAKLAGWPFGEGELGVAAEREDDNWTAGPAIGGELPVFDWGQSRTAAARAAQMAAIHTLTDLRRQAIEDVRRAYAEWQANRALAARVRDELIPAMNERREQMQAAYKLGETDVAPTLLAEQDLLTARVRHIELEHAATNAWIDLKRATGGVPGEAEAQATTETQRSNP